MISDLEFEIEGGMQWTRGQFEKRRPQLRQQLRARVNAVAEHSQQTAMLSGLWKKQGLLQK